MTEKMSKQTLGTEGERLGEAYLVRRGYKILDRNVRSPFGEIDLVAYHEKTTVFVEVKTRRGLSFGFPEESVGKRKRDQLIRLASWYLTRSDRQQGAIRFDVLSVLYVGSEPEIRLIQNAFET